MSVYQDEYDDPENTPLVKRLREEISRRDKALADRDKELQSLSGKVRSQSVRDILREMKVPTKVAGLIPSDVEPTEDNIKKWVNDYRDVLGFSQSGTGEPENPAETQVEVTGKPTVPEDQQDAYRRLEAAESTGGTTGPDAEQQMMSRLQAAAAAAKTADDYFDILQGRKELPT